MGRRTVDVDKLIDECNQILCGSYGTVDYRLGVIAVLEQVLHLSDRYNGFRYLGLNEVPDGEKPGIIWEEDQRGMPTLNFVDADETRRSYYK